METATQRSEQSLMNSHSAAHPRNSIAPKPSFRCKAKQLCLSLTLWFLAITFFVLYSIYIYQALLSPNPRLGNLLFSASNTNFFVSVLSQLFGGLMSFLIINTFDSLRWQFAAESKGVSMPSFFGLSASTRWKSMLFFAVSSGWSGLWCAVRLLLPIIKLFFGSILKFKASFEYQFLPSGRGISIYAGLVPLDPRVLRVVPSSTMCIFFASWIPMLVEVPKFATTMSDPDCSGNCSSVFLPGGLELARKVGPFLNSSLTDTDFFQGLDSVTIYDAPGFLLRFEKLPPTFKFDYAAECRTYGEYLNDSLQLCARSTQGSLNFGWAACPTSLFTAGTCVNNTSWLSAPLNKTIKLTVYRQRVTTSYLVEDLRILHSSPTRGSTPDLVPLHINDILAMWEKVFAIRADSSESDRTMITSLTYSITWMLRLYDDVYPYDRNTPLVYLQNFLAIPLQFCTSMVEWSNCSILANIYPKGTFALPDDMITRAVGGQSMQRYVGKPWTVWAFIAAGGVIVVIEGVFLIRMLVRRTLLPELSGFPELDAVGLGGRVEGNRGISTGAVSLAGMVREGEIVKSGEWELVRSLRKRRVKLVEDEDGAFGKVLEVDGGDGYEVLNKGDEE